MDNSQYDLCIEVLSRLDRAGLLKDLVLVGSWCTRFYRDFFGEFPYRQLLTTRDMDLLIPQPRSLKGKTDVAQLLKDLGFVVGFTGSQGFIRLEHPQLIVEFLVPERGRGMDHPYQLPQLGLNAQALRFLDYLSRRTISSQVGSLTLTLPHPAYFALHKLLIMSRRLKPEKQEKDRDAAVRILHALIETDRVDTIWEAFGVMHRRWQTKVKQQLELISEEKILAVLKS